VPETAAVPEGWLPAGPDPEAQRRGIGPTFWHVVLGLDLALLALVLVGSLVAMVLGQAEPPSLDRRTLLVSSAITLAATGIIPLLWGLGTRERPVRGTLLWFRLERPLHGIVPGLLLTLAIFAGLILLAILLVATGQARPNPVAEELIALADFRLALFVSVAAGFGEEVLFRGLLQRAFQRAMPVWAAIALQAVLFGLLHAGYGTFLQLLVPAALGLAFGVVTHRTRSLWPAIYAHFLFDFVQLTADSWLPASG
jgi:membrane protease YdiL (CAAX protease family)